MKTRRKNVAKSTLFQEMNNSIQKEITNISNVKKYIPTVSGLLQS
jgi:hypothetical protein